MAEVLEVGKPDGTHAIVRGARRTCRIAPHAHGYQRVTHNGSKHGLRYYFYGTYADAVEASVRWADRKEAA